MLDHLAPGRFFGRPQPRLALDGLLFLESVFAPGEDIPPHTHEHPFFYFVLEGVCTDDAGGTCRPCGPSTLIFHPAGYTHANRWASGGGRCLHIEIAPQRLERLRERAPILGAPAEFRGGPTAGLALRLYGEYRHRDAVAPLAIEGLTLEIIAAATRHPGPAEERRPRRWLERVRAQLHDRFAEGLSLSEVAASARVHPVHLARAFRREFGCTLSDYVRKLRVDHAARQLATTDRPLSSVALDAGFAHQSHLCNAFKRRLGVTPAEFRRQCRPR
jgi:AraC family transcriptional regulator